MIWYVLCNKRDGWFQFVFSFIKHIGTLNTNQIISVSFFHITIYIRHSVSLFTSRETDIIVYVLCLYIIKSRCIDMLNFLSYFTHDTHHRWRALWACKTLVKLGLGLSNQNPACVSSREVNLPRDDDMSHLQDARRQPPRSRRTTGGTPALPPP